MYYDIEYYGKGGYLLVSDGMLIFFSKNVYVLVMKEIGLFFIDCNGKL